MNTFGSIDFSADADTVAERESILSEMYQAEDAERATAVNGRITALNGKFRTEQGTEDATSRYGINIPYDTPANFSAGYSGKKVYDLRKQFRNRLDDAVFEIVTKEKN